MKEKSRPSEPGLGEAWPTKPPENEGEFLADRAQEAKRALAQTLDELRKNLVDILDLRAWTQKYPLPTTGVLAVTGFFLGGHLSSSPPPPQANRGAPAEASPAEESPWASLLATAGSYVLKDVVSPLLTEWVRAKQSTPPSS